MARALWRELGLSDIRLEINTLGQSEERKAHREALIAHFESAQDALDEDARRRLYTNPLRILDTKNPSMQDLVVSAPKLLDFLGEESMAHFRGLCSILESAGQPYVINPRLVRGMDYYNLTVFEWVTDRLGSQGTLCGGGRYDPLIAMLGGKPAPGIGWGLGIERVLDLVEELGIQAPEPVPDVYCVIPQAEAVPLALSVAENLRRVGLKVVTHPSGSEGLGSMKSQFKRADSSGAQFALIFGPDEIANGQVALKCLRNAAIPQELKALSDLEKWAHELRSA
jgi:histidyl-tRNA synthetase